MSECRILLGCLTPRISQPSPQQLETREICSPPRLVRPFASRDEPGRSPWPRSAGLVARLPGETYHAFLFASCAMRTRVADIHEPSPLISHATPVITRGCGRESAHAFRIDRVAGGPHLAANDHRLVCLRAQSLVCAAAATAPSLPRPRHSMLGSPRRESAHAWPHTRRRNPAARSNLRAASNRRQAQTTTANVYTAVRHMDSSIRRSRAAYRAFPARAVSQVKLDVRAGGRRKRHRVTPSPPACRSRRRPPGRSAVAQIAEAVVFDDFSRA